eukprot:scaffold46813_cov31-Prasinocladus_malaysianus.AAC.1
MRILIPGRFSSGVNPGPAPTRSHRNARLAVESQREGRGLGYLRYNTKSLPSVENAQDRAEFETVKCESLHGRHGRSVRMLSD